MLSTKRSTHRLSSLFSYGSSSDLPSTESTASSDSTSRLSKAKNRITSATHGSPDLPPPPVPKDSAQLSPMLLPVDSAPAALEPPPPLSNPRSRSGSPAPRSRPVSGNPEVLLTPANASDSKLRKLKRKSGLFGSGQGSDERVNEASPQGHGPAAWVVGHRGKVAYNLTALLNGEKLPELWNEQGDTLVYLFPRTSGRSPSFRIDSSVYAASGYMTRLVHGSLYSETTVATDRSARNSLADNISRTASPDLGLPGGSSNGSKGSRAFSDLTEDDYSEKHLYLPLQLSTDQAPVTASAKEPQLSSKDVETLVTYRNFIAFLIGQSLVATERHPEIFDIFMRIADILQHFQFSNVDDTTYGEVAAASFDSYVDELNLADVRSSREKTIEAIVLGEHMRSIMLYTEGFVHAVGKLDSIKELQSPKFDLISHKTGTRISRAAMDLDIRLQNINTKLVDFDFPAVFSGLMNSDTSDEKKSIRFKAWRSAFMACRSFAHDYYKHKYGSWPPKAKSKKNNLTTSGLNRLVLLDMYHDLSSLYDLLADRTNLTTRAADGFITEDEGTGLAEIMYRALRKVLSEYDRSTPPVQPPIPFDLPLYPSLSGSRGRHPTGDTKDAKTRSRKLKSEEIATLLKESHNADANHHTPFLDAYRHFEQKQAHGSSVEELWEMQTGHWMFLYAVIQSLPMLVIDVSNVRFTQGVEYFLCQPPRSGVPWGREDTGRGRTWFGVAGGSHVVHLPTDIVEHGVEGVFRRSHCWKMAEIWSQNDTLLNAAVQESMNAAPLPPPPGLLNPEAARSRSRSPDHRRRESAMRLGLEALPVPAGVASSGPLAMRPVSSHDPNKTFDSILQSANVKPQGKKKK